MAPLGSPAVLAANLKGNKMQGGGGACNIFLDGEAFGDTFLIDLLIGLLFIGLRLLVYFTT